jgi:hypothetical protein
MTTHLKPKEAPSAEKAASSRANGMRGGRPKGTFKNRMGHAEGRELAVAAAPKVAAELIRLALTAKMEAVRAGACRDVLAYAWGKPAPVEGGGDSTNVTIVNVITGVRG